MTKKLSEIDKAQLAEARRRARDEARERGNRVPDSDKNRARDARQGAREEAKGRGVGPWRKQR